MMCHKSFCCLHSKGAGSSFAVEIAQQLGCSCVIVMTWALQVSCAAARVCISYNNLVVHWMYDVSYCLLLVMHGCVNNALLRQHL
jgi:hypothetical protein